MKLDGISSYNYGEVSNCYNIAVVKRTNPAYNPFSDYRICGDSEGTITNCYAINDVLEDGTVVDSDYMKSEVFVNKLGSAFKQDIENKNQGYPLLKWQE